jgi:hypothetical protein
MVFWLEECPDVLHMPVWQPFIADKSKMLFVDLRVPLWHREERICP